jgi:sec-independent protein translocase protein TatC
LAIQVSETSPLSTLLNALQSSRAQLLLGRVEELRGRLVRLAVVMLLGLGVGFFFAKDIILILQQPLAAVLPLQKRALHFTGPLEVMLSYMKVSFLVAVILSSPYAFFHLWRYIGPALPPAEKKLVLPFCLASVLLFLAGGTFGYYLMLPMGLKWLIGFSAGQATPVITVQEYVDLITFMLLALGGAFQLPLLLIVLERLGLVQERTLKKNRGIILVAILIVAAVAAPSPDPVSQLVMAAPMYLLFEGALVVIWWMKRRGPKERLPV